MHFPSNLLNSPLILVILAGGLVIGGIYNTIAARKRREGLCEVALRVGRQFDTGPDEGIPAPSDFLPKREADENRDATNVVSGKYLQYDVPAFDCHCETHFQDKNGRHTTHFWFSFFLPTMRVAEVFGCQDIQFESAEFLKIFCGRPPDKKFADDVGNAKMMENLLANRDRRISVSEGGLNLRRLIEIRSRLPEYLFTQTT